MNKYILIIISLFFVTFCIAASSWTEPFSNSLDDNTPQPINIGDATQTVTGTLQLSDILYTDKLLVLNQLKITSGATLNYVLTASSTGIGEWKLPPKVTLAQSSCPLASGQVAIGIGSDKKVVCGTVPPPTTTNTGGIKAITCPYGKSIREIKSDGSVGCDYAAPMCDCGGFKYSFGAIANYFNKLSSGADDANNAVSFKCDLVNGVAKWVKQTGTYVTNGGIQVGFCTGLASLR
ncbi:MAG: hypothetical protein WCJ59_01130 [bacterium]